MTELRDLASECLDAFSEALDMPHADMIVATPTQVYAAVILPRLKATFKAIALLLRNGYIDEATVLIRRQIEDSLRIHYLHANQDRSDGLVLDFVRWREELVLKPMDKIINDGALSEQLKNTVKPMAAVRRKRIKEQRDSATRSGIDPVRFPKLRRIASGLDRHADIIAYASAAEVSHSA